MKRKSYSPYDVKTYSIDRFRGIAGFDGETNIEKAYVGISDNAVSFKIAELRTRDGQAIDESTETEGRINSGGNLVSYEYLSAGTDIFVDTYEHRLVRATEIDFIERIPPGTITQPESGMTCAEVFAQYPQFSAYQKTGVDDRDSYYYAGGPWYSCYDFGGGGGSDEHEPRLPPPVIISKPEITIPTEPSPFTCVVGEIEVQGTGFVDILRQLGDTGPEYGIATFTLSGKYSSVGTTVRVVDESGATFPGYTAHISAQETRDNNGYVTKTEGTVSVSPNSYANTSTSITDFYVVVCVRTCAGDVCKRIPARDVVYADGPHYGLRSVTYPGEHVPAYESSDSGGGCFAPGGGKVGISPETDCAAPVGKKIYVYIPRQLFSLIGYCGPCGVYIWTKYYSTSFVETKTSAGCGFSATSTPAIGSAPSGFCVGTGCGAHYRHGGWSGTSMANALIYNL